jgi:hypothetical protein
MNQVVQPGDLPILDCFSRTRACPIAGLKFTGGPSDRIGSHFNLLGRFLVIKRD